MISLFMKTLWDGHYHRYFTNEETEGHKRLSNLLKII